MQKGGNSFSIFMGELPPLFLFFHSEGRPSIGAKLSKLYTVPLQHSLGVEALQAPVFLTQPDLWHTDTVRVTVEESHNQCLLALATYHIQLRMSFASGGQSTP